MLLNDPLKTGVIKHDDGAGVSEQPPVSVSNAWCWVFLNLG